MLSLVILTFLACPKKFKSAVSSLIPFSSEITSPPVKIAISCNIAFLLSPNAGAFTAAIFNVPRSLFTTRVASASPSTSSAIISIGRPNSTVFSKIGNNSFMFAIFLSVIKTNGLSISTTILSESETI